ncbi:MAG: argininosuccinate lyase [Dehalococcoidales bacterium]|jgi:argininosuccinate lyase|nr:argininosuccinate lyase [Dehalococcoidales bacterium]MDX9985911.1 argininosuccinate lyase [Dehalococcoidales bacterium]
MSHIRSRFSKPAGKKVIEYTTSLPFDYRLYPQDIRGSIAHARMLAKQGIITPDEASQIEDGLIAIKQELEGGTFVFKPELEDIHMAVESRLFEIKGDVAGKLHTGRSRNDQIALDMRLFAKDCINALIPAITSFQTSLLDKAETHMDVIMPGCTHLQHAQPVLFPHHLLAYFEMLERDKQRAIDCLKRVDVLPLGSGALAGTGFKIDRHFVASELGFSRISANSIDAVSDRDYLIELHAVCALIMMHLSRLAEEIILWSTSEYSFIELDDEYSTGSSIMPQKKNPDVAELARGKTGRVYGNLVAMLTVMKSLPLSYNRDLQEDKEGIFDTFDTVLLSLELFSGMVATLEVKAENMKNAAATGYILATDVADYLVNKGLSFRQAHNITGRLVNYADSLNKPLDQLALNEYQKFSTAFDKDVLLITLESSIESRNIPGGTSKQQVTRALQQARASIGYDSD